MANPATRILTPAQQDELMRRLDAHIAAQIDEHPEPRRTRIRERLAAGEPIVLHGVSRAVVVVFPGDDSRCDELVSAIDLDQAAALERAIYSPPAGPAH